MFSVFFSGRIYFLCRFEGGTKPTLTPYDDLGFASSLNNADVTNNKLECRMIHSRLLILTGFRQKTGINERMSGALGHNVAL